MVESRARLTTEDRKLARDAERVRYDAQHNPVDRLGLTYGDRYPNPPAGEPAIGGDRHKQAKGGTLDPYHRDAPGEDSPQGSPERPKAPPVHQATEDGRLYEPAREEKKRPPSGD
ncbi:hypothetical protein [Microbaculum marinum]|uniref:Uncharacterized protein n=1 Tax=Microbaculum marinum TaxID=1764581 RepID=A0AAW9RT67_9HYPH